MSNVQGSWQSRPPGRRWFFIMWFLVWSILYSSVIISICSCNEPDILLYCTASKILSLFINGWHCVNIWTWSSFCWQPNTHLKLFLLSLLKFIFELWHFDLKIYKSFFWLLSINEDDKYGWSFSFVRWWYVPGPPRPIFARKGPNSGGHISGVSPLLPPLSILQNPGKA